MTIFFFVVGLEIKRELVEGELRDPRRAALPAIAAVGGMVVPALIYAAFNAGGAGSAGWGIPVATDIAVAVGVVSLLGSAVAPGAQAVPAGAGDRRRHRCHRHHRRLLLRRHRLAARRSSPSPCSPWSSAAAPPGCGRSACTSCSASPCGWPSTSRASTPRSPASSLGLLTPTRPFERRELIDDDELLDVSTVEHARQTVDARPRLGVRRRVARAPCCTHGRASSSSRCSPSPTPACRSRPTRCATPWSSSITHGVVVGLVVGKLVGVTAFTWLAVRLRHRRRCPAGVAWRQFVGHRRRRRHRLHGLAVRHRARLRRPGAPGRGQDRHPRRLDGRRDPRRADPRDAPRVAADAARQRATCAP